MKRGVEKKSVGETEDGDVAVPEDVFLAFEAVLAGFARGGDGTRGDQVFVGDDVRLDEALFEIGVDDARALGAVMPFRNVQACTSFSPAVK